MKTRNFLWILKGIDSRVTSNIQTEENDLLRTMEKPQVYHKEHLRFELSCVGRISCSAGFSRATREEVVFCCLPAWFPQRGLLRTGGRQTARVFFLRPLYWGRWIGQCPRFRIQPCGMTGCTRHLHCRWPWYRLKPMRLPGARS